MEHSDISFLSVPSSLEFHCCSQAGVVTTPGKTRAAYSLVIVLG